MPDSLAFNANFGRLDGCPVAKHRLALLLAWGGILALLLRRGGSARLLGRFRGGFGHRSAPLKLALLVENAPPMNKRRIWFKMNLVGSNGKGKTKFCRNSDMLAQNCVQATTALGQISRAIGRSQPCSLARVGHGIRQCRSAEMEALVQCFTTVLSGQHLGSCLISGIAYLPQQFDSALDNSFAIKNDEKDGICHLCLR